MSAPHEWYLQSAHPGHGWRARLRMLARQQQLWPRSVSTGFRSIALLIAHHLCSCRHALAQSCSSQVGVPARAGTGASLAGFLGSCWQIWRFLADAARLATLFVIFLPAILTSPLAFRWTSGRAAWMRRFRCGGLSHCCRKQLHWYWYWYWYPQRSDAH